VLNLICNAIGFRLGTTCPEFHAVNLGLGTVSLSEGVVSLGNEAVTHALSSALITWLLLSPEKGNILYVFLFSITVIWPLHVTGCGPDEIACSVVVGLTNRHRPGTNCGL